MLKFKNLYFNKDRYDLSEVGRVKLNSKLNLNRDIKDNTLDSTDIIAIIKFMLDIENKYLSSYLCFRAYIYANTID